MSQAGKSKLGAARSYSVLVELRETVVSDNSISLQANPFTSYAYNLGSASMICEKCQNLPVDNRNRKCLIKKKKLR